MRYYYKHEFNRATEYISRRRLKKKEKFYESNIIQFIEEKFPVFLASLDVNINGMKFKPE